MFLSLASLLLTAAPIPANPPKLGDRVADVIAQKLKMKNRYALKLRIESRRPTVKPPHESEWGFTLHIWRDGDKLRVDRLDAHHAPRRKDNEEGERYVMCENCEKEGYVVSTTVAPKSSKRIYAVAFHRLGTWNPDPYVTRFDWRFFGLYNDEPATYDRLKLDADFPKFFKRADVSFRAEKRDGVPCFVAAVKKEKYSQSVWLSERDQFHPVFFEDIIQVNGMPETRTTEITWQETKGGHVYPKKVRHKSIISLGEDKHASEVVVTVTHADFDSTIDPTVFTLAGLNLNENQRVLPPPPGNP